MDPYETWDRHWKAFTRAPSVLLPIAGIAAASAWWLCSQVSLGEVNGLKGQIGGFQQQLAVRDERLKAADEALGRQKQAREEAEKQLLLLKGEIAAGLPKAQAERLARVEHALAELITTSKAVEGVLQAAEGSDRATIEGHVH